MIYFETTKSSKNKVLAKQGSYIIGHKNPDTDSVVSAIAYAILKGDGHTAVVAGKINNETKFVLEKFGFGSPKILEKAGHNDKFILVDHNEEEQWIDGLTPDKVIEIIDHHKFDFHNDTPIEILNKPYGSTATIIAEKFLDNGDSDDRSKNIDKKLASILICAILSDTIVFKSPTTTEKDKKLAQKLAKIAEISDIEELGIELFKKKAEITLKTPREIIQNDFKIFLFKEKIFGEKKIGIGQIELTDLQEIQKRKDKIIAEMNKMIKKNNYFSIILMVKDIINEGSYLWIAGNKEIILKNFKIKDGEFLKGVLSCKKQIVPMIKNLE